MCFTSLGRQSKYTFTMIIFSLIYNLRLKWFLGINVSWYLNKITFPWNNKNFCKEDTVADVMKSFKVNLIRGATKYWAGWKKTFLNLKFTFIFCKNSFDILKVLVLGCMYQNLNNMKTWVSDLTSTEFSSGRHYWRPLNLSHRSASITYNFLLSNPLRLKTEILIDPVWLGLFYKLLCHM